MTPALRGQRRRVAAKSARVRSVREGGTHDASQGEDHLLPHQTMFALLTISRNFSSAAGLFRQMV